MKKAKEEKTEFALIRAKTKEQIQLFDDLKRALNEKTNAGALMKAGALYLSTKKTLDEKRQQIEKLNQTILELENIVKFVYHSNEMVKGYGAKRFTKGKFPQG